MKLKTGVAVLSANALLVLLFGQALRGQALRGQALRGEAPGRGGSPLPLLQESVTAPEPAPSTEPDARSAD